LPKLPRARSRNEGAELKFAKKVWRGHFDKKRYKVITLEHSFHGRTISTLKATGQKSFHTPSFSPYPDGFLYVKSIEDIYSSIDDETVAVLIELVQGEGGVEPFSIGEVQNLAKFLRENGILLIVDEVQTGVFRTGEMLASNIYQIEPDIITLAKGLGGGVPIGAIILSLIFGGDKVLRYFLIFGSDGLLNFNNLAIDKSSPIPLSLVKIFSISLYSAISGFNASAIYMAFCKLPFATSSLTPVALCGFTINGIYPIYFIAKK